jgi:hypothetical protein
MRAARKKARKMTPISIRMRETVLITKWLRKYMRLKCALIMVALFGVLVDVQRV